MPPRTLRAAPAKTVRFDNSDGLIRNTLGRPVQRRSPAAARVQAEDDDEPSQREDEAGDDEAGESGSSTEEDVEVMPPIQTRIEVRWVLDKVREAFGTSIKMGCWRQPDNELMEDFIFAVELNDIKQQSLTWCTTFVEDRSEQWAGYSLLGVSANVSHKGNARDPVHFALDYFEYKTLKSVYEQV